MTASVGQTWDVFISHASEDKDTIARPLARRLETNGIRVWIDEQELVLGDSLRKKIDSGLSASKWGVVILSPSFLSKEWPQAELDALVTRELNGERVLLPVWHRITAKELAKASPLLASRLGIDWARGIDVVCDAILGALSTRKVAASASSTAERPTDFPTLWFTTDPRDVAYEARKPDSTLIGSLVDRYTLREYVGLGGSGIVFRAHHRTFGRDVALKILLPMSAKLKALTRATERAVRGLGALRDPRIVDLLDFGYLQRDQKTTAYLAYDFARGDHLNAWAFGIQSDEDCWHRMLHVATEIASALDVAHKCDFVGDLGFQETGILHGDLKPSNILVRPDADVPLVLDFMIPDLQRMLHNARNRHSYWEKDPNGNYHYDGPLTGAYGTPGFMPPEQELDGIVSRTSDVYALGWTLIRTFWVARSEGEFLFRWMRAKQGNVGALQQRAAKVLDRMILAQPSNRPQTMEDVVTDLLDLQSQRVV